MFDKKLIRAGEPIAFKREKKFGAQKEQFKGTLSYRCKNPKAYEHKMCTKLDCPCECHKAYERGE